MKMGFAEVDITPERPVTMVGFDRADNISRGILDRLTAQISVWEDNGTYCLATIDNIGFNKREANLLRDGIGAILGAAREKVMPIRTQLLMLLSKKIIMLCSAKKFTERPQRQKPR